MHIRIEESIYVVALDGRCILSGDVPVLEEVASLYLARSSMAHCDVHLRLALHSSPQWRLAIDDVVLIHSGRIVPVVSMPRLRW